MTYREMLQRFAAVTGLRRRLIVTLPVLTPGLASHWVGLVTPIDAGVAKPLVGSLVHDVVAKEKDLARPRRRARRPDRVRRRRCAGDGRRTTDHGAARPAPPGAAVAATAVAGPLATYPGAAGTGASTCRPGSRPRPPSPSSGRCSTPTSRLISARRSHPGA